MEHISTELIVIIVGVFTLGFWLGGTLKGRDTRTIGVNTVTRTPDVDYEISGDDLDRIHTAIDGNRKIEAIKIFRAVTGAGLKDAKDAVDMMARYHRDHPG